jgi:hypothetical protein
VLLFLSFPFLLSFLEKKKQSEKYQMSCRELLDLITSEDANQVKLFLEENPTFNVNEDLNCVGWTALHFAHSNGHHKIVSVLLARSKINVNSQDRYGSTPFLLGCLNGKVEVVKILLKDSRVDINLADDNECTPLWCASCYKHVEVIKWMIAVRGDELSDLDKKGKAWECDTEYNAIEIARERNMTEVVSLLERFIANPTQTRHEIRVELGLVDKDAAELFAMIIFLCDDFLRLKNPTDSPSSSNTTGTSRFFTIMMSLPIELQMMLCYRVFGSSKENIKSKDSEPAFKHLVKKLMMDDN